MEMIVEKVIYLINERLFCDVEVRFCICLFFLVDDREF